MQRKSKIKKLVKTFWQGIFLFPIKVYKITLSPLLPTRCAYKPTCSQYTAEAIRQWGVARGIWMGAKRIGRCHPLGGFGYDPVPGKPDERTS